MTFPDDLPRMLEYRMGGGKVIRPTLSVDLVEFIEGVPQRVDWTANGGRDQ